MQELCRKALNYASSVLVSPFSQVIRDCISKKKAELFLKSLIALAKRQSIYICFVYNPYHELNLLCSLYTCGQKASAKFIVIIGSNNDPDYLDAGRTLTGASIYRRPQMVTHLSTWQQKVLCAASAIQLANVSIVKSVPYQYPRIDCTKIATLYYGDGFGIFPENGELWWNPSFSHRTLDAPFKACNYINQSLLTFGPKSCTALAEINDYLKLARHILDRRALKVREQVDEYISSFTDIVVLSQLSSAGRASEAAEHSLYKGYISDQFFTGRKSILLLPHPVHSKTFANHLLDSIRSEVSNDDKSNSDAHPKMELPSDSFQGIQVEVLASIASRMARPPAFHVFQTSYLSLSLLFNNLQLRFGYPEILIDAYFKDEAKDIQILFQRAAFRCASFLKN